MSDIDSKVGKIVQIIGPVLDVEFEDVGIFPRFTTRCVFPAVSSLKMSSPRSSSTSGRAASARWR